MASELIVNCETGEVTERRMSRKAVKARDELQAAAAAHAAEREAAETQRQEDLKTLVQHADRDPVAAAAARLLGLR